MLLRVRLWFKLSHLYILVLCFTILFTLCIYCVGVCLWFMRSYTCIMLWFAYDLSCFLLCHTHTYSHHLVPTGRAIALQVTLSLYYVVISVAGLKRLRLVSITFLIVYLVAIHCNTWFESHNYFTLFFSFLFMIQTVIFIHSSVLNCLYFSCAFILLICIS